MHLLTISMLYLYCPTYHITLRFKVVINNSNFLLTPLSDYMS